jgi:hypothetical protein
VTGQLWRALCRPEKKGTEMSEISNQPPGWYPDPSGLPGQKYWDGSAWILQQPQAQYAGGPAKLGPSVWATNAMALYSLGIGGVSYLLLFFCGAGTFTAIISGAIGWIALKKSNQLGGVGRGMALWGIGLSIGAFVIGVIGFMVFGGAMMSW